MSNKTPLSWPSDAIARASATSEAVLPHHGQQASRDLIIELRGSQVRRRNELALLLGQRLSLPELASIREPNLIAGAVNRRLTVMADAERHATLVLSEPDRLPQGALDYILDLFEHTPLRLLLLSTVEDSQATANYIRSIGLPLFDFDEPEPDEKPLAVAATAAVSAPTVTHIDPPENKDVLESNDPAKNNTTKASLLAGVGAFVALGALTWLLWPQPPAQPNKKAAVIEPELVVAPPATQPLPSPIIQTHTTNPTPEPVAEKAPAVEPLPVAETSGLPRYTIQIASYSTVAALEAFLDTLERRHPELRGIEVADTGQQRWVLVYGDYLGYSTAVTAIASLPAELIHGQPFVVGLSKLENAATPADND